MTTEVIEQTHALCATCHTELLSTYYFCPNCGTVAHEPPLSTSIWTQTQLYMFSIVLPMICFLTISKWKGIKYLRSEEKEARVVGVIACLLLVVSTIYTIYFTITATEKIIQSSTKNINLEIDGEY